MMKTLFDRSQIEGMTDAQLSDLPVDVLNESHRALLGVYVVDGRVTDQKALNAERERQRLDWVRAANYRHGQEAKARAAERAAEEKAKKASPPPVKKKPVASRRGR